MAPVITLSSLTWPGRFDDPLARVACIHLLNFAREKNLTPQSFAPDGITLTRAEVSVLRDVPAVCLADILVVIASSLATFRFIEIPRPVQRRWRSECALKKEKPNHRLQCAAYRQ